MKIVNKNVDKHTEIINYGEREVIARLVKCEFMTADSTGRPIISKGYCSSMYSDSILYSLGSVYVNGGLGKKSSTHFLYCPELQKQKFINVPATNILTTEIIHSTELKMSVKKYIHYDVHCVLRLFKTKMFNHTELVYQNEEHGIVFKSKNDCFRAEFDCEEYGKNEKYKIIY